MKNVTGNKWHGFVPALLATTMLLAALPTAAMAAVCPPNSLTTLSNGNPADAAQVMDNFNYIIGCPNFTGNVGIGVPSPLGALHVRKDVAGNDSVPLILTNAGGGVNTAAGIFLDPNNNGSTRAASVRSRQSTAGNYANLEFWVAAGAAPTKAMTIVPSGNTGIGINPGSSAKLFVYSSGSEKGVIAEMATVAQDAFLGINDGNGYYCYIGASSYAITCNGPNQGISDERLKKDIKPLTDSEGLDAIMAIKPVHYRWKDERKNTRTSEMGFLAQNVEKVLPELVGEVKGDKEKKDFKGTIKGLSYDRLTAPMVLAIQQLKEKNDALEARLKSLDGGQGEKTEVTSVTPLTPTLWALLGMAVGVIVTYAALRKRA